VSDVEENKMNLWLRTDEHLEAVVSLEMVSATLPRVMEDVHYWKWVIIALHNALQGYMVLALTGPNGLNVLKEKCRQEWITARQRGDKIMPERRLDDFLTLYKKIKRDDLMLIYMGSQSFKPGGTQTENIKLLNELRNDFIHFLPKFLSLDVQGLPRTVNDCIDMIEFLAFECGNILWLEEENETKTKDVILKIRSELHKLEHFCGE
jgi:hypothetical protein